ncbi:D-Ala-D-Ala carboxypeptidase VanY [Bacillus thermotolerans]|uniref:D-Ala-D-Ala carboxypeptidase VanY n=1 Tax=Bacillus thermotolerans TaxID=1221996 RepID=UPI00057FD4D3|nr:D-Ala-D-Ala carboxypeptidase VanY [Bacillus thermotolerans]KKB38543.1 D-alanyl-D-alanine carboxypeptidase [Bacillus thermotolerans]
MKKASWLLTGALLLSGCQQVSETADSGSEKPAEEQAEKIEPVATEQETAGQPKTSPGPQLEAAYFNQIKQIDGKAVIANPENPLVLVNKEFALPAEYKPQDLVRPNVEFSFGDQDIDKSYIRKEAAAGLEKMFAAAKEAGIQLYAVSGYRSYERQQEIMNNQIASVGSFEKAAETVAPPGQSEHQSGLAMDISAESVKFDLVQSFEHTKEGQWLANNAHKYGFILRYPKDKENITKYAYEPWHFRYVGVKAATEIFENQWTLEEYFKEVEKI